MKTEGGSFRLSKRSQYALAGWACGMALGLLLYFTLRPSVIFLTFPPLVGMSVAIWYGESTHKIPTADEMNRPPTLFSNDKWEGDK